MWKLELATAYLNLEKFDQARELLEPFIRNHPEALPAYQMLCELFWEQKEYDAAESLLRSVGVEVIYTTHSSIEEIASRILMQLGLQREMF